MWKIFIKEGVCIYQMCDGISGKKDFKTYRFMQDDLSYLQSTRGPSYFSK